MTKLGFRRSLAGLLGDSRHLVIPLALLGFVAAGLDSVLVPHVRAQEREIGPEEAPKDNATGGEGRVVETDDPLGRDGIGRPATPEFVSPTIRRLLGRLVSKKPAERKAAERVIRKMGAAAVPDLRAWLGKVRLESERVEILLRSILSEVVGGELPPTAVSRDFSASVYFERKLRQAQEHLKYGRYNRAKRIAESILELDGNTPLRFLCRRLIRKAAVKKVSEKLEARVDVGSLVYEVGEKPEIVFRLQNRSGATARFEVRESVFGEVTITVERRFLNGHRGHSTRMAMRLPQKYALVSLAPGQGWEFDIPFETPKDLPIQNVAVRVKFHAVFRPTLWEIEGEPDGNIPLRTVETEIWLIPPGKKRKFEDPLKRLTLALLFDRPEDFLIAGWFCAWAGERDRDLNLRLIDRLALEFEELDPKYHLLAHELLRHATGRIFKKPEDWTRWWRREKAAREREEAAASADSRSPDRKAEPFTDRD
jgi:hypothetical protein